MLVLDRPTGAVDAGTPVSLEEYLALPEDTRCEIVDGVLRPMVRPSKLHREVQLQLVNILKSQRAGGLQVATVDDKGVVHFKEVTPGRDSGLEIEISSGLTTADRIVANPGERIVEGSEVTIDQSSANPDAGKTAVATSK